MALNILASWIGDIPVIAHNNSFGVLYGDFSKSRYVRTLLNFSVISVILLNNSSLSHLDIHTNSALIAFIISKFHISLFFAIESWTYC